jgi:hypothetical protein
MHTYPISKGAKEAELNIIKSVLRNNEYDENITERPSHQMEEKTRKDIQNLKTKGATFTYSGKEIRKITKLFHDTEINIAFRTQNTI